jgi:hypothetical protein
LSYLVQRGDDLLCSAPGQGVFWRAVNLCRLVQFARVMVFETGAGARRAAAVHGGEATENDSIQPEKRSSL